MKKNTLSKIAGGVATLALAATLTACGGNNLADDKGTCKEFKVQVQSLGIDDLSGLSAVTGDTTKAKEVFAKMVEVGKKSTSEVGKAFVTMGEATNKTLELSEKIKANPSDSAAMEEMKNIDTSALTDASNKIQTACAGI
ncbi:hypothetical protein [Galactobacter valiniphilus]|uniref:hypothetical protein n=1 Tax=Galactobacter valiniphilus TaxID=2676122 RepID=UPI003736C8FF